MGDEFSGTVVFTEDGGEFFEIFVPFFEFRL